MKKQLEDLQAHMKKELEDMQARRKELEEMRARKEKEEWQARKKKELDDLQAHIKKEIEEMEARKEEEAVIRRISELPLEDPSVTKPSDPVQEEQLRMPVRPVTIAELMRECLWSLKKTHKDEDARVKRAFQTLHIYAGNVVKNPDEEKYRKIRLSNQAFKDRVGELRGGIEFLELCGFAKSEDGEYLYMPRDKVDITVLNTAGRELQLQIENPQLFV